MLLGNKKQKQNNQDWCLILNPIYNEIDKRKVSRKISDTFGLSIEEASDLVNNTPIILLDNLQQQTATQVKDHFRTTGAEILLTNDLYLKRKCYRTVWPDEPSLDFLKQEEPVEVASESEKLHPDQALSEMKSLRSQVEEVKKKSEDKDQASWIEERGRLMAELDKVRKDSEQWQDKYQEERQKAQKIQEDLGRETDRMAESNQAVQSHLDELENNRAALADMEERYAALDAEYKQAKQLFEEKMNAVSDEAEEWKNRAASLTADREGAQAEQSAKDMAQISDLEGRLKEAGLEIEKLRDSLQQSEESYEVLKRDYETTRDSQQERLQDAEDALQDWKQKLEQKEEELQQQKQRELEISEELETSKGFLRSGEERRDAIARELEELKAQYEQKDANSRQLLEEWKAKTGELDRELESLRFEKQTALSNFRDAEEQIAKWKERALGLDEEVRGLRELHEADMSFRQTSETRLEELEQAKTSLMRMLTEEQTKYEKLDEQFQRASSELEAATSKAAEQAEEWTHRFEELSQKTKALESSHARLLDDLKVRNSELVQEKEKVESLETKSFQLEHALKDTTEARDLASKQLESKDRELDTTRRQLREMQLQREQYEIMQKSASLTTQLTEKEARLKQLVQEQEKAEQEIRDRESRISQIFAEQENLEKEILDGKQAKRHYQEQLKKEKPASPLTKDTDTVRVAPLVERQASPSDD